MAPVVRKTSSVSSSVVSLNTVLFTVWLLDSQGLVCILPVLMASQDPPSCFWLSSTSLLLSALSLIARESSIPPLSVLRGILAEGAFLCCGIDSITATGGDEHALSLWNIALKRGPLTLQTVPLLLYWCA